MKETGECIVEPMGHGRNGLCIVGITGHQTKWNVRQMAICRTIECSERWAVPCSSVTCRLWNSRLYNYFYKITLGSPSIFYKNFCTDASLCKVLPPWPNLYLVTFYLLCLCIIVSPCFPSKLRERGCSESLMHIFCRITVLTLQQQKKYQLQLNGSNKIGLQLWST